MPTLLLSDDDVTVQRLIAMAFANHGLQVVSVDDGEAAIARITELRPDIVVASIGTPRRNGYDVAAHVKSTPALAATPVLLLGAAFETMDQARAAEVRCDGVLVKPFEARLLVSRVMELLRTDTPGPLPSTSPPPPAVSASSPRTGTGTVDDYFDRLDAALARRTATRRSLSPEDVGTVPTIDSVLQPAGRSAPAPAAPAIALPVADALVDEVTRRVVEQIGTAAVRDIVREVVAETAERLIREQIARIRQKA